MIYLGQKNRQAQKPVQKYNYISNSITKAAYLRIVVESHKYTVQDIPVGELLFKLLIQKKVINIRDIYSHLRENITNLET